MVTTSIIVHFVYAICVPNVKWAISKQETIMLCHTMKKSNTSQHKSSVRDILDMFIEGIVNLVKSLYVILVL